MGFQCETCVTVSCQSSMHSTRLGYTHLGQRDKLLCLVEWRHSSPSTRSKRRNASSALFCLSVVINHKVWHPVPREAPDLGSWYRQHVDQVCRSAVPAVRRNEGKWGGRKAKSQERVPEVQDHRRFVRVRDSQIRCRYSNACCRGVPIDA